MFSASLSMPTTIGCHPPGGQHLLVGSSTAAGAPHRTGRWPGRSREVVSHHPSRAGSPPADHGKVRVVALVSPTCGTCLRGASDLQRGVFGPIRSDQLRGYIVWVPKLDAHEKNVPEATHTVADPRGSHFWDSDAVLVHAYDTLLGLATDAWDMYLLYGPDAQWNGATPPRPQYWMHQLGSRDHPAVNGPYLNTRVFPRHVRDLLP